MEEHMKNIPKIPGFTDLQLVNYLEIHGESKLALVQSPMIERFFAILRKAVKFPYPQWVSFSPDKKDVMKAREILNEM